MFQNVILPKTKNLSSFVGISFSVLCRLLSSYIVYLLIIIHGDIYCAPGSFDTLTCETKTSVVQRIGLYSMVLFGLFFLLKYSKLPEMGLEKEKHLIYMNVCIFKNYRLKVAELVLQS